MTFLIVSLAAHTAVLLFFLEQHINEAGQAAQETKAISVELVMSSVIQAAQFQPETEIETSSDVSMSSSPPELIRTQPEELTTQKSAPGQAELVTLESNVIVNDVLDIISTTDEYAADEPESVQQKVKVERARSQQQKNDNLKAEISEPHRKHAPKPAKKKLSDASNKRSNAYHAAGASNRSAASSGRISASKGDLVSYAARVRAQVASRRPDGNGVRGTVVIAFSIARSGALGSARISSSSGNTAIDRATLSAVRSAGPFPPPPSGSGPVAFAVPFHYR